jgi:TPP-dependent pyruvate/acetoin dehydrogenase alpha subunit
MKGHAEHDNAAYVPAEILEEWKAKDPLARYERVLLETGALNQNDIDSIQHRVRQEIDSATDEAEKSPMPDGDDAGKGLFKGDGYWNA